MSKKAWHFLSGNKLRDGREAPEDGVWLEHEGGVFMCSSGLHASTKILDALQYAPGDTICRVECDDIEDEAEDKIVCRKRMIIARVDGEKLLRRFARKCALDVIHLGLTPDIVVRYLKTGDESLREAAREATMEVPWGTAWGATWEATWEATRQVAREATLGPPWEVVRQVARGATWQAAREVAMEATWGATWEVARQVARGATREAVRQVASEATWEVAWATQERRLVAMFWAEVRKNK
jgi:hypothetical protein